MLPLSLLLSTVLAQSRPVQASSPTARPFPLMVGDPAPALSVSRWLKGSPVARFEPGQVYVVEFWATWCGPCVRGIPHLTELQERFAGKVQVIGVDVWEPETAKVEPFVKEMGARMEYSVAMDDAPAPPADCDNATKWSSENGKTSLAWLHASGWHKEGIPVAFIVDAQGRVAWIGGPQQLDESVASVVAGRWDLARETQTYRHHAAKRVQALPIQERLNAAQRKRDFQGVVGCIDELLALDPEQYAYYAGGKFQTLLLDLKEHDEAYAFAREALTGVAKDSFSALGQIAYVIVFMSGDVVAEELAVARAAATRANELTKGERPGILDTLARVHFLSDEIEQALELQKKAVALARDDGERKELEGHLREYERARG